MIIIVEKQYFVVGKNRQMLAIKYLRSYFEHHKQLHLAYGY